MIRSGLRYLNYFLTTLLARKERNILFRDVMALTGINSWKKRNFSTQEKEKALHAAASWLFNNQSFNADSGFSTFYIVEGHTGSYPETSGYIIDSLFHYNERFSKPELNTSLFSCADWLVSIQKPSGGWQSGYVNENKKEVVFNTGQVMRGLLHAYTKSHNAFYLSSCIKAADWLCSVQEMDGSWKKFAFMEVKRTYESYVSAALLELWKITGTDQYKNAAIKNIDWILNNKVHENGWLEDCDNTIRHNNRPILHTIAYTIDGIIDCGILLGKMECVDGIRKTADILLEKFLSNSWLGGRFSENWEESEAFICTGGAQISIVWMKLFKVYGDQKYLTGAKKMNNWLCWIQSATLNGRKEINGAIQGSFPLYGRYEPFAFPNWATKYLVDALMMETELN